MPSSAQTILEDLLEHERKLVSPNQSQSDFFEQFSSEQILKNFGLSYDEIDSGIVGSGGDGGIDSFYTFVNGVLVAEEGDFQSLRQNIFIELFIVQSKTSQGFSDETILRVENTIKKLLDISNFDLSSFRKEYNDNLLRVVGVFHDTYRKLMSQMPELKINIYYATQGDHVHPNVKTKSEELIKTAKKLFTQSKVQFHFLGAEELLRLARKSKIETLPLNYTEAVATQTGSAVCLVKLQDYYDFIHDPDTGELRGWLFEENVRDYEGKNIDVNKAIRGTLDEITLDRDFWWLNNGITVVSAKSPSSGKTFVITEPKVVNGLQTSMEIYNYFRTNKEKADIREILVRIIVTEEEKIKNDIIKATNSQSAIKPASLRAFDEIHYKIEQYLFLHGWYYERRKNFYKNQKKPKNKIISIAYMAQAVAAIVLQRPNDSRGRPITIIKNETIYKKIFDDSYPVELYIECIRYMKLIEEYLDSDDAPEYIQGHSVNVRFQLAMFASAAKAKRLSLKPSYIQKHGLGNPDKEFLDECLRKVWSLLEKTKRKWQVDEDRVSKSPNFDELLKETLRDTLHPKMF